MTPASHSHASKRLSHRTFDCFQWYCKDWDSLIIGYPVLGVQDFRPWICTYHRTERFPSMYTIFYASLVNQPKMPRWSSHDLTILIQGGWKLRPTVPNLSSPIWQPRHRTPAKQTVLSIEEYRDHLSSQGLLSLALPTDYVGDTLSRISPEKTWRHPRLKEGLQLLGAGVSLCSIHW